MRSILIHTSRSLLQFARRHYFSESRLFTFPRVIRCFMFTVRLLTLLLIRYSKGGSPWSISAEQCSFCQKTRRSLSQSYSSFFACVASAVHHVHLSYHLIHYNFISALSYKYLYLLCTTHYFIASFSPWYLLLYQLYQKHMYRTEISSAHIKK